MKLLNSFLLLIGMTLISIVGISQGTNPVTPSDSSSKAQEKVSQEKQELIHEAVEEIKEVLKKEEEKDSTKFEKLKAEFEKLKKIIEEGAKDTSMIIGKLWLKDTTVIEYYSEDSITDTITIKEVVIQIRNGVVNDIQVFANNNQIYTNKAAGITLSGLIENSNKLVTRKGNKTYFIYCQDIMGFKRKDQYFPADDYLELTELNQRKELTKKVGINSLIDARIYSDLLGLLGKESNGLAQTEVNFAFPLHRINLPNTFGYWLGDLSASFQFSRLDEKYQSTNVSLIDSNLSRSELNQRRWLHTEIGLSLFSHTLQKKSSNKVYYNLITGFSLSNVGDFNDTSNVSLPFVGGNIHIKLSVSDNFGMNISLKGYNQYLPSRSDLNYGNSRWVFAPQVEVFFNPYGKPGSKIFGRTGYVGMEGQDPFWQIQFGYTLSFSELINGKVDK